MAEKDVDEQFAATMAHWDDVTLGADPYGDPQPDLAPDPTAEPSEGKTPNDAPIARAPEIRRIRDVADLPDLDDVQAVDRVVDDPVDDVADVADDANVADVADVDDVVESWDVEADEPHYTPPPPAPLPPSEDKHFWLMIVALVAGPLLFLYLLLFNRDGNGWWMVFALFVSIAGFVLLVLRQPLDRDDDDDGIRL